MSRLFYRTVAYATAILGLLAGPASADQILETHNASLTSYVPTSKSSIQDVRALVDQRGVNLDGSLRAGSTHRMAMAGNPFGESWSRNQVLGGGVRLDTGTFLINDVDLSFPATVPWVIGRSYNARQKDSGGSYFASGGYQGNNWFQSSQPELVFHDSETDSEDMIYLVYGADRYIEFRRGDDQGTGDSTDTFKSVNGAAGAILIETDAEGPDLATYYDQNGHRMVFFWFNDGDIDDDIEGSIWKKIDPDDNAAYVGHETDASTALSSYDASTGAITTAYDSAGRRFTYTYTSGMLTEVKAEVDDSGWQEVGKVQYSYYINADSHGQDDDLEVVTLTTPLTDSGVSMTQKKLYWYYEGTYDASTNPGYHHQLQYVIDYEGYRSYDWDQDSVMDGDPESAAEEDLKPYASSYFEYDTERRIVAAWFGGSCGCSGAASGEHAFEYESNGGYTDYSGYDTTWKSRTIVQRPEVTYETSAGAIKGYVTQYFDEVGQPLHRVHTDDDPDGSPNLWATHVTRNADGQVEEISSPANVTAYTHSTASFTTSTNAGLVTRFTRFGSGTDMEGFVEHRKHATGTSGSAYLDGTLALTSRSLTVGDAGVTRPLVSSRRVYTTEITSGTTGSRLTSYSYSYHSATSTNVLYLALKQITTTNPAVSAGNNGSGSATTSKRYIRQDGTTAFSESEAGSFTYTLFDEGQLTKRIDDAQTNHGSDFASGDDPNTDFGITENSDGWRRITTYAFDDQGRADTVTQPDGRVLKRYYTKIVDGRYVILAYNDYETSPSTKYYGPVQYTITNLAGKTELQATVALSSNESSAALTAHFDELDSDPVAAMDLGTVARLNINVYDETGTVLEETRAYYDIVEEDYDTTSFGYDDQGRRVRNEAAHGTITRTDHDSLGRVTKQWVGTNDSDFDGGESSGTDDMVKTLENVYDSGNDKGNSSLTKRTLFVEDSTTDKRETTFAHDVRGRVLLQTNPTTPHVFTKYDNMGRLIASGLFKSTGSITVGTDDPTTETSNRMGLSQTFFDEMGRVWKSQRHKIDPDDGSDDDNLQTLKWYDEAGRVIKVDGQQLAKTAFDRFGRTTHQFILASDNDSSYADADDVAGDIVLVENQTTYESSDSDDVIMTAAISRFHDDYGGRETTGALDTNADADTLKYTASNVEGRIQITASWYDRFGRLTETVRYGTCGGSDFNRDGLSVPSRSDTALLTEISYRDDGARDVTTDPRGLKTGAEYDDAGRQTAVISNYVNGEASDPPDDTDNFVRYEYTDGLQTTMWVDLDGDDAEDADDQVTTYTFGTTKGASAGDSKIGAGHLIQKITYPDSADADDVVTFAYNAQSQQIYKEDQDGNVIEIDFDDSGRAVHRRVTTLAADFDGAVRRISTVYDHLGRVDTVTQYDHATVGSGSVIDQVAYTCSAWGPISSFRQDHNSAVGGTLLYDIDNAYAKATSGRNTIRRSSMDLPDGTTVTFNYLSTGDLHDAEVSRVSDVTYGGSVIASYAYNGAGQVVGTDLDKVSVMWHQYGSSGSYPDLDRFDRVTSSRWTKDLATDRDFYDLDINYDRNSNITLVEDNVHAGFDVSYTIDDRDRLTDAQEGTWGGSSITSETRQQTWSELSQTGNWEDVQLDLDGDGSHTGTDEYDDDRTHNVANEVTLWKPTTSAVAPDLDDAGNVTDDKANYEYVYDAFYRLRQVNDTDDQSLVAEYTYNGLGYRIGWHFDSEPDDDVDGDDPWYRFVYDERWRIVGVYQDSDSDPTEQFIYHCAGADGTGGSSYIDDVIRRDRDTTGNGTLDETVYYCQNWRHDVIALIDGNGGQVEQDRYSAYGIPFGLPAGDADSDGDVDSTDRTIVGVWSSSGPYDVRGDIDLDGDVDSTDLTAVTNADGDALGWNALSLVANRKGYAGYELDDTLSDVGTVYHVRHRVMHADLGRWLTRDPAGYVDGPALYSYGGSAPLSGTDPFGLQIVSYNDCLDHSLVQALLAFLAIQDCPEPTLRQAPASDCEILGAFGLFCCNTNEIWMCPDATCTDLAEELSHAVDLCNNEYDCGPLITQWGPCGAIFDLGPRRDACPFLICTEFKAVLRLGTCCGASDPVSFALCVWNNGGSSIPLQCVPPNPNGSLIPPDAYLLLQIMRCMPPSAPCGIPWGLPWFRYHDGLPIGTTPTPRT